MFKLRNLFFCKRVFWVWIWFRFCTASQLFLNQGCDLPKKKVRKKTSSLFFFFFFYLKSTEKEEWGSKGEERVRRVTGSLNCSCPSNKIPEVSDRHISPTHCNTTFKDPPGSKQEDFSAIYNKGKWCMLTIKILQQKQKKRERNLRNNWCNFERFSKTFLHSCSWVINTGGRTIKTMSWTFRSD